MVSQKDFALLFLFTILLGCSSGPLSLNEAALEFSATRINPAEVPPGVTVEINETSRLLEVHGFVTLPCFNYDPRGSVSQAGSLVVMTIWAEEENICATDPAVWSYTGLISNLKPGQYTFRVVQPVPDFTIPSNPSEVVFEQDVEIP